MNTGPLSISSFVLIALASLGAGRAILADTPAVTGSLHSSRIDYHFVGHLEQFDDAGRLLVWEASIDGAFTGKMKWWFVNPPPVPAATYAGESLSYYKARWEIWSDDELLVAGESAGKTVFRNGGDGVWDGSGVVTEAAPALTSLKGSRIYETGPVIVGSNPPVSYTGTGMFVIH